MQAIDPPETGSVCVNIAGVDASIRAPLPLLGVLNRTLVHARRPAENAQVRASIEVAGDDYVWQINGRSARSTKALSATSALPQVAGAVVSALIADAAESAQLCVWRATVVESQGEAIAFVGDDWESGVVLATHLHSRGWRLLGGDYALVDRATMNVLATRKLLYITLSHVDELPMAYRRAVEASPWYSTQHDIAFYAVDPALAATSSPWAERARLRAVLKVDGNVGEFPSLERAGPFVAGDGIDSDELERAGIAVAEVRLGDYPSTCDLLQRWYRGLGPSQTPGP